ELFAAGGVEAGDVAAGLFIAVAPVHALYDLAVNDQRSAGVSVAFRGIGIPCVPEQLAGTRVEGKYPGIGCGEINLVLIKTEAADRAMTVRKIGANPVLPDQLSIARVERLHDVPRICQVHDAVMDDGGGLVGGNFGHGPRPYELQLRHI